MSDKEKILQIAEANPFNDCEEDIDRIICGMVEYILKLEVRILELEEKIDLSEKEQSCK